MLHEKNESRNLVRLTRKEKPKGINKRQRSRGSDFVGTGRMKEEPWMANERTMAIHNRILEEIFQDEYEDNKTYGLNTLQEQTFTTGYQVAFIQRGDNYTPREYANIVNAFLEKVPDHRASVTKVNGYPVVTFHIPNTRSALHLARKYGQNAIWDWMNDEEVQIDQRRH